MAKFSACYQLCPLIDQKSFLGVSDESVNGCVIITLGKNMVIRYKLSDQKQVSSWSSRDKLSAPVVYDVVNQQYIGVFNANQISSWENSCVQLSNLKKFKFSTPIECVLTNATSATPVVVFHNGHISPLQQALHKRKEAPTKDPPLAKDETIIDALLITLIGSVMVALFTTTPKKEYHLHLIPLEEGLMTQSCLHLKRKAENQLQLIGHALITYESCRLLTLWSDGQLFSLELPTPDQGQFPGQVLTSLAAISPHHQAAMLPLSPTHIAVYGADKSEEGALLIIFNSQLRVVQCRQYFKLYSEPARLWAGGQGAVLVAAGQYVTVVPYYLGKQRLAALLGSQDAEPAPVMAAEWGDHSIKQEDSEDTKFNDSFLCKTIRLYMEEGMSQRMICQSLFIPTLDAKDVEGLTDLLETITDIPETCIISVLILCLEDIEAAGYRDLLHKVLLLPVTPDLMTLQLLRHKLTLAAVITLLQELCEAMLLTPADPQLIEWATLLLDAHYQQYLLSRDKAVIETLTELKAVVDKQIEDMQVWQQLEPLLLQLPNIQGLPDPSSQTNTSYCIEQIKLY